MFNQGGGSRKGAAKTKKERFIEKKKKREWATETRKGGRGVILNMPHEAERKHCKKSPKGMYSGKKEIKYVSLRRERKKGGLKTFNRK